MQKQLIIIDIPVHALKHMCICKLHVSLIMFAIKYVYGDIIIGECIQMIVSFRQKLYSLKPQTRTVGRQWHIAYMRSHVTYMQYIFK